jgi:hypothetical protein
MLPELPPQASVSVLFRVFVMFRIAAVMLMELAGAFWAIEIVAFAGNAQKRDGDDKQ